MWGGETTNQRMRKNQSRAAALLCLTMQGHAQTPTKGGGISSEMLTQIERNGVQSSDRVISNALATNKIDDLALNFKEQGRLDTYFSVETPAQSIHNQKSSGRCWLFSGLNVLRANFARLHKDSIRVEYSQVYLSFYDQLEKANLMLQGVIDCADKPIDDQRVQFFFKNPLNDGGTFCGAADLAEKYGVVPMEAMPEPYSAENTSRMAELISSKLREFGLELRKMVAAKKSKRDIQARKTEMLGTVYHMLTVSLGNPVKEFTYAFKDKNGKTVKLTDKGNGEYTFTMPGSKVEVKAEFVETVTEPENPFRDVNKNAYYYKQVLWAVEKGITEGTGADTFSPNASCTRAQMVTFLWRAAGSPAPKSTTNPFRDVRITDYYYDAVLWAVENGITSGTGADTFSPTATVTRGQTVTFLYRAAGSPTVGGSAGFSDVNANDYYNSAVAWAAENNITGGTGNGKFSPKADCTRGQIVTFLYRGLAK